MLNILSACLSFIPPLPTYSVGESTAMALFSVSGGTSADGFCIFTPFIVTPDAMSAAA